MPTDYWKVHSPRQALHRDTLQQNQLENPANKKWRTHEGFLIKLFHLLQVLTIETTLHRLNAGSAGHSPVTPHPLVLI